MKLYDDGSASLPAQYVESDAQWMNDDYQRGNVLPAPISGDMTAAVRAGATP